MPRTLIVIVIVLAGVLATFAGTIAQEATPPAEGTPVDGCTATPRSEGDLMSLEATAQAEGATPLGLGAVELPAGEPVAAAALNALDETLRQVAICAKSGDLGRLLALYSDAYVTGMALAPEPVPIIPGHGHEHAVGPVGTPSAESEVTPQVETAVRLPDGRIAAFVTAEGIEGSGDIVFFVEERGQWVIDDVREALPEGPIGGDLPFAVQAAVAAAAAARGVAIESVSVVHFEAIEWGDTSLGCPKEGEFYAQVITPGYLVLLSIGDEELEYHTDAVDRAIPCDQA